MNEIDNKIDQLLHDAEHAEWGGLFAAFVGHPAPAAKMQTKYQTLFTEASKLYLDNPGATWPDCEWPAPVAAKAREE